MTPETAEILAAAIVKLGVHILWAAGTITAGASIMAGIICGSRSSPTGGFVPRTPPRPPR